jgi:hypothetical protein
MMLSFFITVAGRNTSLTEEMARTPDPSEPQMHTDKLKTLGRAAWERHSTSFRVLWRLLTAEDF